MIYSISLNTIKLNYGLLSAGTERPLYREVSKPFLHKDQIMPRNSSHVETSSRLTIEAFDEESRRFFLMTLSFNGLKSIARHE